LKQAVSFLKADGIEISAKLLGRARADGLPGFRGSRVDIMKLLPALRPWLEKRAAKVTEKESLECQKLRLQIKRLMREDEIESGKLIEAAKVDEWMRETAEHIKHILRNHLRNQLPPKLEGLRASEIAAAMEPTIAAIIDAMREPPK